MNKQQQGNNNNKNPAEKHKPMAEEKNPITELLQHVI